MANLPDSISAVGRRVRKEGTACIPPVFLVGFQALDLCSFSNPHTVSSHINSSTTSCAIISQRALPLVSTCVSSVLGMKIVVVLSKVPMCMRYGCGPVFFCIFYV